MTNVTLAQSYLNKCAVRLKALRLLLSEQAYSDVVREAQEVVELAQKAMLRLVGVEPPKHNNVGYLLLEYRDMFTEDVRDELEELAEVSKWLRKERELAFYGDVDFIPTVEYGPAEADRAFHGAHKTVAVAERALRSRA
ncbi:MAG: HEPN domain-containing protein [Bacillota bacterium]